MFKITLPINNINASVRIEKNIDRREKNKMLELKLFTRLNYFRCMKNVER